MLEVLFAMKPGDFAIWMRARGYLHDLGNLQAGISSSNMVKKYLFGWDIYLEVSELGLAICSGNLHRDDQFWMSPALVKHIHNDQEKGIGHGTECRMWGYKPARLER